MGELHARRAAPDYHELQPAGLRFRIYGFKKIESIPCCETLLVSQVGRGLAGVTARLLHTVVFMIFLVKVGSHTRLRSASVWRGSQADSRTPARGSRVVRCIYILYLEAIYIYIYIYIYICSGGWQGELSRGRAREGRGFGSTLAVYVYVVPGSEFPITPFYPHCPQGRGGTGACAKPRSGRGSRQTGCKHGCTYVVGSK